MGGRPAGWMDGWLLIDVRPAADFLTTNREKWWREPKQNRGHSVGKRHPAQTLYNTIYVYISSGRIIYPSSFTWDILNVYVLCRFYFTIRPIAKFIGSSLCSVYIHTSQCVCVCVWMMAESHASGCLVISTGRLYTIYTGYFDGNIWIAIAGLFFFAGAAAAALWKKAGCIPVHLGRIETCVTGPCSPPPPITPENNRNRLMSDRRNEKQKGPTILSYFDRVWWGNLIRASPSSIAGL